jgi:hypothetical protein
MIAFQYDDQILPVLEVVNNIWIPEWILDRPPNPCDRAPRLQRRIICIRQTRESRSQTERCRLTPISSR